MSSPNASVLWKCSFITGKKSWSKPVPLIAVFFHIYPWRLTSLTMPHMEIKPCPWGYFTLPWDWLHSTAGKQQALCLYFVHRLVLWLLFHTSGTRVEDAAAAHALTTVLSRVLHNPAVLPGALPSPAARSAPKLIPRAVPLSTSCAPPPA